MSDRIFSVLWLGFCAAAAGLAWSIEAPFSYEPIGPRAFPLLLSGAMALSAAWILLKPDREPDWPHGRLLGKVTLLVAAFLLYAFLFDLMGFPLATGLMTVAVGRVFDGGWKATIAGGVCLSAGLWFFFDRLLDVTLPLGLLFKGG